MYFKKFAPKYFLFTIFFIILSTILQITINLKEVRSFEFTQGPTTEQPQLLTEEPIAYKFLNKKMYVTFDSGKNWLLVPATIEEIFYGEYEAPLNELIMDSYVLTTQRTGFLIGSDNKLMWLESCNQGQSWESYPIFENLAGIRFRKIEFLEENFAYVLASSGRTMGQEGYLLLISKDNGKTWMEQHFEGIESVGSLLQMGGFLTPQTGFIGNKLDIFVTNNQGESWTKAIVHMPEKYQEIFVIPEMPQKNGENFSLLINQGGVGDYKGGTVKGLFESVDQGNTWNFIQEVTEETPNE